MQTLRALFIVALAPLVSGFGSFPEGDAKSLAKHIPKCTSTVPYLPLVSIAEAVSVANCTLVIQHTKVQFDKVAAASSTSVEDNKNCLADAYAQHGLCLLTKEIVGLFAAPAGGVAPNCGAVGAAYAAQFAGAVIASFGSEGADYVLTRANNPCEDYPLLPPE